MNITEVKERLPLADVFEIKPGSKYMIRVPNHMEIVRCVEFGQHLVAMGFPITDFAIVMGDFKVFDLGDTQEAPPQEAPKQESISFPTFDRDFE